MGDSGAPESDGTYSSGERQSLRTDDHTYLRGAQPTDRSGIARFSTIFPCWYTGRTVHIHLRVHLNKKTVLTSQLYFDDALYHSIYQANAPYSERIGRDTCNDTDDSCDQTGMLTRRSIGRNRVRRSESGSKEGLVLAVVSPAAPGLTVCN